MSDSLPASAVVVIDVQVDLIQGKRPSARQSIAYYNQVLDGFGAEDGFGNGQHEIVTKGCAEIDFAWLGEGGPS